LGPRRFGEEKNVLPPPSGFESIHRLHYPGFHESFCLIGNVRVLISVGIIGV